MKSISKASWVNNALQVIQYISDGKSVVEASRIVVMPRSLYYYFVENTPEAITEEQVIIEANQREKLG